MKLSNRTKIIFLLLGDIVALYGALVVTLAIRYGSTFLEQLMSFHLFPFSFAFAVWLLVFYIAGLYDLPRLRNNIDFAKTLGFTLSVNALLTITLFYLIPFFGITPKTNLFIFIAIFAFFEVWWRRNFNVRASFRDGLSRVLLLGEGAGAEAIREELKNNPQVGYEIVIWERGATGKLTKDYLSSIATRHAVNLIVVPSATKENKTLTKTFYELLASGIEVIDMPAFYERVFRKIPLSEIGERWFLENHIGHKKFYDELKRGMEFIAALLLIIVLFPLEFLIALFVRITSTDKIVCTQMRVGQRGTPYRHHKFRTMRSCNEPNGAQWKATTGTGEINDPRLTKIGRVLSYSHLDELPQLINILKGEMSFVGPRPERPEFVETLEEKIPYYRIRHLVRPGVTGWAQINYQYGGSVEGTYEKLQYDLYYLKNRSLFLDLAIIIKTIKTFFVTPK